MGPLFRLAAVLICLAAVPQAWSARVLVDEGHGQRFSVLRQGPLDLSSFGALVAERGGELQVHTGPLDDAVLEEVGAVVISGAFTDFTPAEQAALNRHLEQGGRVLILLHVGPLNGHLLDALGVGVSKAVVLDGERRINDSLSDFATARLSGHPLVAGLDAFNLYGTWALNPKQGQQVLAWAGPRAWLDMNRNRQPDRGEPVYPFALAIAGVRGAGAYLVFGDDAILQNRFLVDRNRQLGERLAAWLNGGVLGPDSNQ